MQSSQDSPASVLDLPLCFLGSTFYVLARVAGSLTGITSKLALGFFNLALRLVFNAAFVETFHAPPAEEGKVVSTPYNWRKAPDQYNPGFFNLEHQAIQRSLSALQGGIPVVNFEDMGGSVSNNAQQNTSALYRACDAVQATGNSGGGGVVLIPGNSYAISEFSFRNHSNVHIVGAGNIINDDGTHVSPSQFKVTSGVFGVRFPPTSWYCGMQNIALLSNGVLNPTPPCTIRTPGTEYGILIETGSTFIQGVQVQGFQQGVVGASGLNGNVFDRVLTCYNTKTGFAVTSGTAAAYAVCHPNLTPPASPVANTKYKVTGSAIFRNAVGMVLRDGLGSFDSPSIQNQYGPGLIAYEGALDNKRGALDNGPTATFTGVPWFEDNWSGFDVTQPYAFQATNSMLFESAGVPMAWTNNNNTTLSDAGYHIISKSIVATQGKTPSFFKFENAIVSLRFLQKAAFLQSSYLWKFLECGSLGGDQANAWRFGDGAPFNGTGTFFRDFNGTLPANLGDRGVSWKTLNLNPILKTGVGHTVDDVVAALQGKGLPRQT
jgi:hypothetical protein